MAAFARRSAAGLVAFAVCMAVVGCGPVISNARDLTIGGGAEIHGPSGDAAALVTVDWIEETVPDPRWAAGLQQPVRAFDVHVTIAARRAVAAMGPQAFRGTTVFNGREVTADGILKVAPSTREPRLPFGDLATGQSVEGWMLVLVAGANTPHPVWLGYAIGGSPEPEIRWRLLD